MGRAPPRPRMRMSRWSKLLHGSGAFVWTVDSRILQGAAKVPKACCPRQVQVWEALGGSGKLWKALGGFARGSARGWVGHPLAPGCACRAGASCYMVAELSFGRSTAACYKALQGYPKRFAYGSFLCKSDPDRPQEIENGLARVQPGRFDWGGECGSGSASPSPQDAHVVLEQVVTW